MASFSFNATNVDPGNNFDPIPAGWYVAQIIESEIKPTSKQTGHVLNLTWEVLDGQYKGRKIFDRVNVQNQNPEAERIGQQQMSGICHAVGRLNIADTADLHRIPCQIKVKITKDDTGKYDDKNECSGYKAMSASGGIQVQAAPQQNTMFGGSPNAAVQAPAAAAVPPWQR